MKAVLLDLDNTLYSYAPCNAAGMDAVYIHLHHLTQVPKEVLQKQFAEARTWVKKTVGAAASSHSRVLYFQRMTEQILGRTDASLVLDLHAAYLDAYFAEMKPHPAGLRFLSELRNKQIKIIIVTDLTTEIQLRKIVALGIGEMIDGIVTSEEAGAEKPHPKIFELARQKAGCAASDCVFVGDDVERDVVGAQQAGMRCVLVKKPEDLSTVLSTVN